MASLILPSVTTHSKEHSWREKLAEIQHFQIPYFSLFVTGLNPQERKKCFAALKELRKVHAFEIPFCHAVSSMSEGEFWELNECFGTERFNLHPTWEYPLQFELSSSVREMIYIENSSYFHPMLPHDLQDFAGLCIDLSHLEDSRLLAPVVYEQILELAHKYPVGANHISAVSNRKSISSDNVEHYSTHLLSNRMQMEYLSEIPKVFISDLCAIELNNPIRDQLSLIAGIHQSLSHVSDVQQAA